MSKLRSALREDGNQTVTENGMPTYKSSLNACVDFFFEAGSARGKDVTPMYTRAFNEEKDLAIRLALWLRDVRGGAGERQLFRDCFTYILSKDTDYARRVLQRIPELGRWDDVLIAMGTPLEKDALFMIKNAIDSKDGLCAKWMPRPSGGKKEHREAANKIRNYMRLSPKDYRKMLVALSNTVEQKMCSKDWDGIDYSKLPSLASARYQKAFSKNDPIGYTTYREGLKKGDPKVKVNAGAVYPYDVVKSSNYGDTTVSDAQWKALPNYLEGSDQNILPMVDVSDSMFCPAGGMANVMCIDVAISLGLYISERNEGAFKDSFMTFSERPEFVELRGSLSDRLRTMRHSRWGMNTNLELCFNKVLSVAKANSVAPEDMPTQILVLSDMQFDRCARFPSSGALDMIRKSYEEAGYEVPNVVFWNLKPTGQVPAKVNAKGVALVSGFSPSLMATILGADPEEFTPRSIMLKALNKDRYNF